MAQQFGVKYTGVRFIVRGTVKERMAARNTFLANTGIDIYSSEARNPSWVELTAAERSALVASRSYVCKPVAPSSYKDNTAGIKRQAENEARWAAERKAEYTCVDCGLYAIAGVYRRQAYDLTLCQDCLNNHVAAINACIDWARIAAHCDVHTAVLRRDDGSCGICESEAQARTYADLSNEPHCERCDRIADYTDADGLRYCWEHDPTYVAPVHCRQCGKSAAALADDGLCGKCWYDTKQPTNAWPLIHPIVMSDIELLDAIEAADDTAILDALMAELDRRTTPHGRVLAPIAGGSNEELLCGFSRIFTIDGEQHYAGCGNAATYSARHKIDGDVLGCCELCADRAKRRGYVLTAIHCQCCDRVADYRASSGLRYCGEHMPVVIVRADHNDGQYFQRSLAAFAPEIEATYRHNWTEIPGEATRFTVQTAMPYVASLKAQDPSVRTIAG